MSTSSGIAKLTRAYKDLRNRWRGVREVWRDDKASRLEQALINPLESDVRNTVNAMTQMAGLLQRARSDCE